MTPEEFDYLHEHYRFYIDTTDYCRETIRSLDSGWFGLLEGFLKYMEPEVGEPRSLLIGVQKSVGALHVRTCNTSTRINGLAQKLAKNSRDICSKCGSVSHIVGRHMFNSGFCISYISTTYDVDSYVCINCLRESTGCLDIQHRVEDAEMKHIKMFGLKNSGYTARYFSLPSTAQALTFGTGQSTDQYIDWRNLEW